MVREEWRGDEVDKAALTHELDRMYASEERLVKRYFLRDDICRRHGGQGVVQVRSARGCVW